MGNSDPSSSPDSLIQYLKDINDFGIEADIEHVLSKFIDEFLKCPQNEQRTYIETIISEFPKKQLPQFLDSLITLESPEPLRQRLTLFLLTHKRPLFQEKGLELARKLNDPMFLPLILDKIYSNYAPVQHKAIDVLLTYKGDVEGLLEEQLKSRSSRKQKITIQILRRVNPNNVKLALKLINDPDFLVRIQSISVIGKYGNKKHLKILEEMLKDPDLAVRKAAIDAVSQLGGTKAKTILRSCLEMETHPPLREIIESQLRNFENNAPTSQND